MNIYILFLLAIARFSGTRGMSAPIVNKLRSVSKLQNQYFALRHGNSLANQMKIISSDPAISTIQHGLSELGHEQAQKSASEFSKWFLTDEKAQYSGVAIFSSDFTRARETAEHMAQACANASIPLFIKDTQISASQASLYSKVDDIATVPSKNPSVNVETRLRERYFGKLNGKGDFNYDKVWEEDALSSDHTKWGVESVDSVTSRVTSLVLDIDNYLSNGTRGKWCCLLVAHGDVLQICQTAFCKLDGSKVNFFSNLKYIYCTITYKLTYGTAPNNASPRNSNCETTYSCLSRVIQT